MTYLFNTSIFDTCKSTAVLQMKCDFCLKQFARIAKDIKRRFKNNKNEHFCSYSCYINWINKIADGKTQFKINCSNCNKNTNITLTIRKRSKTGKFFCSHSCATTYNNTHKTKGTRKSKLEFWLELQLKIIYPNLEIHHNRKDTINSELDIYIPSLKLAFELNGIFHYKPIYGINKLNQIKNNDNRKFQACLERGIELVIINTSSISYCVPKNFQKSLEDIKLIIDLKSNGADERQ